MFLINKNLENTLFRFREYLFDKIKRSTYAVWIIFNTFLFCIHFGNLALFIDFLIKTRRWLCFFNNITPKG